MKATEQGAGAPRAPVSALLATGIVEAVRRARNVLHGDNAGVDVEGVGFGTLWRVERSGVAEGRSTPTPLLSSAEHPRPVQIVSNPPSLPEFKRELDACDPSLNGQLLQDCLMPPDFEDAKILFPNSATKVPKKGDLQEQIDADTHFVTCKNNKNCHDFYIQTSKSAEAGQYECTTLFGGNNAPEVTAEDSAYSVCLKPQYKTFWAGRIRGMLDPMYQLLVSAEDSVDYTQLDVPDGLWKRCFRNAMRKLNQKAGLSKKKIAVRLLFGMIGNPTLVDSPSNIYNWLTTKGEREHLDIRVAIRRDNIAKTIWNHSKTLISDRKATMVGGINVYDTHYFRVRPVTDINVIDRSEAIAESVLAWNDLLWADMAYSDRTSYWWQRSKKWGAHVYPSDALERSFESQKKLDSRAQSSSSSSEGTRGLGTRVEQWWSWCRNKSKWWSWCRQVSVDKSKWWSWCRNKAIYVVLGRGG